MLDQCKNGHPYNDKNTYITKQGKYHCRECHRLCEARRLLNPEVKQKNKERAMTWVKNNREWYKELRNKAKANYRKKFDALKSPCKICKESDVACLDFHHRDPKTKLFNIGMQYGKYSWKNILLEVEKCDVLCSNCHRKLHAAERAASSKEIN